MMSEADVLDIWLAHVPNESHIAVAASSLDQAHEILLFFSPLVKITRKGSASTSLLRYSTSPRWTNSDGIILTSASHPLVQHL
jgi:hypothetical protein